MAQRLALCWEAGVEWPGGFRFADDRLHHAWSRRLNAPEASAVGRLFDAAAALTGLVDVASFEGHGPMWLEAASSDGVGPVTLPLTQGDGGVWRSDWAPLLPVLLDDRLSPGERGTVFHASLAAALLAQARRVRAETRVGVIGLTGGVFQNKLLAEMAERQWLPRADGRDRAGQRRRAQLRPDGRDGVPLSIVTSASDIGPRIGLAHGNGGRFMRELIDGLFRRHLANPLLDTTVDAVLLPPAAADGALMTTTDGFTVEPLEFPGGNIGSLAVHGTVNELAVAGATPLYLTVACFLEEGLEVALLDRLISAMAAAAGEAEVRVVAGDTKVVRRGEGGGVYFATTGIGLRNPDLRLGIETVRAGDRLLVSGPVGDHGTAVMLAREQFGLRGDLVSDSASVLPITRALTPIRGLRFMRDPTRGGLVTVAHDLARLAGLTVRLDGSAIPVRDPVAVVCEMLGYDPLYLACEGRVLAVVAPEDADAALTAMRAAAGGAEAAIVGGLHLGEPEVVLETELGGERLIEELEDDPLPRIC